MKTFFSLVRLFLRLLATKGRMLALGALAIGMVLLSAVTRGRFAPQRETWRLFELYALGGLIPISALVIASSAFGDLVDDRTLVHLWLRPISRATMILAAFTASVAICLPFTVIAPISALFTAGMPSRAIVSGGLSSILGTLGYCGVFLAVGLRLKRALLWGLAYILIWEGVIANYGRGLSRLALRLSTRSISFRNFEEASVKFPISAAAGSIVLIAVTVCALAVALRWLRRADVA